MFEKMIIAALLFLGLLAYGVVLDYPY